MPDSERMGLAVDISCRISQGGYEMVDVEIKYFKNIGRAGKYSGNFVH